MKRFASLFALLLCVCAVLIAALPAVARKSGGTETIKVSKCYYAGGNGFVELLIKASSSNTSAHLLAYLPSGKLLGEVQNGGGSRYGGTVFVTSEIPATITIKSSAGASVTAPCTPFQL
jgi:hypothetical protein